MKKMDYTIRVAKTKALISCAVYCTADLRLCFRLSILLGFLRGGSFYINKNVTLLVFSHRLLFSGMPMLEKLRYADARKTPVCQC